MHAVDVTKRLQHTKASETIQVHAIIFDNRKVNLSEIAEILKMSKELILNIVHKYMDMRKHCSKFAA